MNTSLMLVLVAVLGGLSAFAANRSGVSPEMQTAVGAGATTLGFLITIVFWMSRRKELTMALVGKMGELVDGLALFNNSDQLIAPASGVLAEFPGVPRLAFIKRITELARTIDTGEGVPEAMPKIADQLVNDFLGGRVREIRLELHDGRTLVLGQVFLDDGPRMLIARETTDATQRERALRESEARYIRLTKIASDWIWETDANHRFTVVSGRFEEITGVQPENLIGKRFIEVANLRKDPGVVRDLQRLMREQEHFSDVTCPLKVSGKYGPVQLRLAAHPMHDASGRFLGYRGVAADITRQRRAEVDAEAARRSVKDAIAAASEGIALFDSTNQFVMCNRTLANTFAPAGHLLRQGCSLDEIMTGLFESQLLRVPEGMGLTSRRRMLDELREGNLRREFAGSKGNWYRVGANKTADDGLVLIVSDITGLKKHEATLAARIDELQLTKTKLTEQKETLSRFADNLAIARNEAEAASRAKSGFLAAVSHELRTPLNAIIGFSEVMSAESFGPLGNPKYKDYAGDILDSGQHLLGLINNILNLSKAEAGSLTLSSETINLAEAIEISARIACPRNMDTNLTIEIDPELGEVQADSQKLKQILINLISNAVKFTPTTGSINVAASRLDNGFEIAISDTGIGMRAEEIPHALTAFRQIDSSLGRKYDGTGLGLPLAKRFTELHGGTLRIESSLGEGTTVTVFFPDRTPQQDTGEDAVRVA
ncbi:MAG: ATP-binding protein [Minwuia sp.]|nr:ATP-binding protein [Minwuia sp.]